MPKEIFKASRIVIKDLPRDMKVSSNEMKAIKGGKLFRPEQLTMEWLSLAQRDSEVNIRIPLSAQVPQRCYRA
jgi:hypothetical protein